MAMGRRKREEQGASWIAASELPQSGGHLFYQQVNKILDAEGFDRLAEGRCWPFYAEQVGRPSPPPAVYFRVLLIGYFEGSDSERGIAWRVADSLGLRRFLGYGLTDQTADHSTIKRDVKDGKADDVCDPTTGQIRSDSTDNIACWFIDTDYNGESFFVRHAYFTGAAKDGDGQYDKLKRALRAETDEAAWSTLYSTTSRPFDLPSTGKIVVRVINHYGDEVLKVFNV